MKLFYSTTSPFARKVLMVLNVSGLIDKTELVLTNPLEDETLRQTNPLGKIPALVDYNLNLVDSPLICEYLDDLATQEGQASLFHRGEDDYYRIQLIHSQADGIIEAAVAIVYEGRRNDAEKSAYWLGRWQEAITSTLKALRINDLGSADHPHIGTIATVATLGYLDFRLPNLDWRSLRPDLATWYASLESLPWVKDTVPK